LVAGLREVCFTGVPSGFANIPGLKFVEATKVGSIFCGAAALDLGCTDASDVKFVAAPPDEESEFCGVGTVGVLDGSGAGFHLSLGGLYPRSLALRYASMFSGIISGGIGLKVFGFCLRFSSRSVESLIGWVIAKPSQSDLSSIYL
jgi:hypothetical protein